MATTRRGVTTASVSTKNLMDVEVGEAEEREVVEMVESNMQGVMSTTIQVIEEPILTATPTTVAPTTARLLFTAGLCMNVKASFQLSISSVLLT